MKWAYYNENDPKAAAWLRVLIAKGLIMDGEVDERSIKDVEANDVKVFTRVGFFAGIGGWDRALQLAGWPEDRPVWHGSCPCQPFSIAGKGGGVSDERHLWPEFHRLIADCRPPVVYGEQVASKDGLAWLDLVQADMEVSDYAFWAADLCAAGVGAPHIRQRLYWVAENASCVGRRGRSDGDSAGVLGSLQAQGLCDAGGAGPTNGFWGAADWLFCKDGKWRPVRPGSFPLASGVPARVALLRGFGNSIIPELAAEFIKAYMSATK